MLKIHKAAAVTTLGTNFNTVKSVYCISGTILIFQTDSNRHIIIGRDESENLISSETMRQKFLSVET